MPSTTIEIRTSYSPEQETAIIDAVQAALVEAFKIPVDDRCVRLICHAPHRFICPSDRSSPERYTVVTVTAFQGRSLEAKRRLYQAIVGNLAQCGIARDHVKILLHEVPLENWGLRGGVPASELNLGFEVNV